MTFATLVLEPIMENKREEMKNGRISDRGPVRRTLTTLIGCIRPRVIMCRNH